MSIESLPFNVATLFGVDSDVYGFKRADPSADTEVLYRDGNPTGTRLNFYVYSDFTVITITVGEDDEPQYGFSSLSFNLPRGPEFTFGHFKERLNAGLSVLLGKGLEENATLSALEMPTNAESAKTFLRKYLERNGLIESKSFARFSLGTKDVLFTVEYAGRLAKGKGFSFVYYIPSSSAFLVDNGTLFGYGAKNPSAFKCTPKEYLDLVHWLTEAFIGFSVKRSTFAADNTEAQL